jgi:hypothetical protein
MTVGKPRQVEGEIEPDDLRADGIAGPVKDLANERGPG